MTLLALFANPITYHQGPTAGRGSSCLPATPGRRTNTTCREPPSKVSGTISPWPGRKHFRSETNTSSLHYLSRLWQHLTVLANSHPLRGGGSCVGGGENRDERLARRRKKAEKWNIYFMKYVYHTRWKDTFSMTYLSGRDTLAVTVYMLGCHWNIYWLNFKLLSQFSAPINDLRWLLFCRPKIRSRGR